MKSVKRIPVILAGILFSVSAATANFDLAVDLFEEGDWPACRRECLRVSVLDPDHAGVRLLSAASLVQQILEGKEVKDDRVSSADQELRDLAAGADDRDISAMASLELGRLSWFRGDIDGAFDELRRAFVTAPDHELFLRAGCSLDLLIRQNSALARSRDLTGLESQLNTCRPMWTGGLARSCVVDAHGKERATSRPGKWIVAFYRSQVRPAIGSRCSLEPSCSEYYKRASGKHGLLGVAMIGDRLVREPGVVSRAEHPVVAGGKIHYADPLDEHDWWMER
ncbi:MAG: membrane protein insertion efficiency factor YidD [Verrucomicrobia bacterium]|nr:membrane protein insertion efficiency factor YidD [Verrucomicrobiota bacterium]